MGILFEDEDNEYEWGIGVYTAVAPIEDSKQQTLNKQASREAAKKLWAEVCKELKRAR